MSGMKEEWLIPGAVVPVDAETTAALVAEIKRLIGVVGDLALRQALAQPDSNCNGMPAYEGSLSKYQKTAQPEERGHCTCGDPTLLGYVHFRTRPCIYYTAPPKREWVGLTDEVIWDIKMKGRDLECVSRSALMRFAREIEAANKEKNT